MKPIYWKCTCGVAHDHVDRWSQHQSQNRCKSSTFTALGRDETISAVRHFHIAGEQPHDLDLGLPSDDRLALRSDLIQEEAAELIEAIASGDLAHILKEAADLQYVLDGFLIEIGADRLKLPVFRAVHHSNMSKYDGETNRSPEGKILKGEHYQGPDIRAMIGEPTDD